MREQRKCPNYKYSTMHACYLFVSSCSFGRCPTICQSQENEKKCEWILWKCLLIIFGWHGYFRTMINVCYLFSISTDSFTTQSSTSNCIPWRALQFNQLNYCIIVRLVCLPEITAKITVPSHILSMCWIHIQCKWENSIESFRFDPSFFLLSFLFGPTLCFAKVKLCNGPSICSSHKFTECN